ncbi:MAG: MFS transporter [Pseudomonadota bacterium]
MSGRLPIILIVAIVMINALGIGIILPVMPALLMDMGKPDISSAVAIGGFLSLAFAAMQVIFGPLLGQLSDRFGRRPVLLLSLLSAGIDYAILAAAPVLWLFVVARLISGVASATQSVANAALADMSPPEKRAARFGLTGAAFGIGFVLGPVMGGLLGELGPRAPFWMASALSFVAAGLCYVALPETLARKDPRPIAWREALTFAAFVGLRRRPTLIPYIGISFADGLAGMVFPAVWAYFAWAQFGWSPATVGWSLAA